MSVCKEKMSVKIQKYLTERKVREVASGGDVSVFENESLRR